MAMSCRRCRPRPIVMEPGSPSFAAEEPAKLSSEARDLMHAGCSGRQRLIRALKGKQRLPLVLLKSNGTRRLGCGARKLLDVLDSPCHHQVNGEAVLRNRAIAESAVLDAP